MTNNEVRIKPLLRYEVTTYEEQKTPDVFTADGYEVREGRTMFFRSGNLIREYQQPVYRIVATPDEG